MFSIAIIGAMYGDEGKGLTTDYICDRLIKELNTRNGAVVRFQGGAQAGHTVVDPNGTKHIFSHFGSGTLHGLQTVLTSDFVCNPLLLLKEYDELCQKLPKSDIPKIQVNEECYVTTPYDVLANRNLEKSRGKDRHGTTGVGFGETIEREEVAKVRLRYIDLFGSKSSLVKKINNIKDYYTERARVLDLPFYSYDHWIIEMMAGEFTKSISLTSLYSDKSYDFLVFEGSQGLKLDMEYGDFPHVTRSRTGLTNVHKFCSSNEIELDQTLYVTRAYTTRHGAGPLAFEESAENYSHVIDETNVLNKFQGSLRFAPLNIDELYRLIRLDSADFDGRVKIMMTCMDQLKDETKSVYALDIQKDPTVLFESRAIRANDFLSYGPTRDDVRQVKGGVIIG